MPKWRRIPKEEGRQPNSGNYNQWKYVLREEGRGRCVYCGTHESSFGGAYFAHVEHFRPKSKFGGLTNTISNLYYACAICNAFKGNDWPGEPDGARAVYLDPSQVDYTDHFLQRPDRYLVGTSVASRYMVERLNLNRAQLLVERWDESITNQAKQMLAEAENLGAATTQVTIALAAVSQALIKLKDAAPYERGDTSRA